MKVNRLLTNLCSTDLEQSKSFYTALFDFKVDYDSDWFVHLISDGRELEIGIISAYNELVPESARGVAAGFYLTFVVDDVDDLFSKAQQLGCTILQSPQATFYGNLY